MNKLNEKELLQVVGGSNILTAAFLNAIARCLNSIYDIGRAIGSSISRIKSGKICS